ncbi:LOW QUALITY PROTEIN: aminopeptidase NAALADL1 [Fundulus heteroclitus]|uniref:LOW QUALITY PROTEIN: aminopeptidase NAALADL1 n=1 Tax=Fundulus heteroclitus TaxID=8078 RepID=UPI00165BB9F0|nr:LOW QUALITY PROTEIN: aminopeptidase NAALADL1 [Fundulus heteroclitus]
MIKEAVIGTLCGLVVLTIGILIGHFGIEKKSEAVPSWLNDVAKDVDEKIIQQFLSEVDTVQIQENLRELTKVPHLATSPGDEQTVQFVLNRWQDAQTGLDKAWRQEYKVYLSFPDPNNPNKVTVVNQEDSVLFSVREKEETYYPEQDDPQVVQPYAAYSPAGHARGKLVYANQGKPSDYERLNQTIDLRGTIAITRYGGEGRGAKAINAAAYGVVGVLVYTDPLDINDGLMSDTNETYPHSWYLPPSGVERGAYSKDFGDLLTPYLAAKEETYRIPPEDISGIPPIPTQPIGFEDARSLICELAGDPAPSEWQGGFDCTYNYGGPGFKPTSPFNSSDVKLDIFNQEKIINSSNVMGVITGSVEPDRYVIYGNHRDSWVHGAIDPSSGTSVMLEITRVLGGMVKQGKWRPRRSIIFGSWGAYIYKGMKRNRLYLFFLQEYFTKLSERTVGYINVDIAVFANATLRASAMPSMQSVIFQASRQVNAAGFDSTSVYDNWIRYSNRTSPTHGVIPRVGYLNGAGSDYAAFVHYLGIASIDMSYTYDRSKTNARIYPAYHTAYDTFHYASNFIDPGFVGHQAVGRTAGNILIRLADSLLLPFNCSDYAESLEDYLNTAVTSYQTQLQAEGISMEPLKHAVANFRRAAEQLDKVIQSSDLAKETPLKVRKINDQLMLMDRAFLNPLAFPDEYGFRHVIWASSSSGKPTFPGLADAFARAESSGSSSDWQKVHYHLSVVSQAIEGAADMLNEVI